MARDRGLGAQRRLRDLDDRERGERDREDRAPAVPPAPECIEAEAGEQRDADLGQHREPVRAADAGEAREVVAQELVRRPAEEVEAEAVGEERRDDRDRDDRDDPPQLLAARTGEAEVREHEQDRARIERELRAVGGADQRQVCTEGGVVQPEPVARVRAEIGDDIARPRVPADARGLRGEERTREHERNTGGDRRVRELRRARLSSSRA